MDPLRIVVRVVLVYIALLVFIRLTGKTTVKQGSPFDFVVALILGDLIDDAIWAEVNASVFLVATGSLVLAHTAFNLMGYRAGLSR